MRKSALRRNKVSPIFHIPNTKSGCPGADKEILSAPSAIKKQKKFFKNTLKILDNRPQICYNIGTKRQGE